MHNDAGRLAAAVDPDGNTGRYTYDAAGNLVSIDRVVSSTTRVLEITPKRGPAGSTFTIYGTGFSTTPASNTVTLNGCALALPWGRAVRGAGLARWAYRAKAGKGKPKPSPKFQTPTNPAQHPPSEIPPGWRVRRGGPTALYPDGYWKLEKPMKDGSWQGIDPSTMRPGTKPETHIPFPQGGAP